MFIQIRRSVLFNLIFTLIFTYFVFCDMHCVYSISKSISKDLYELRRTQLALPIASTIKNAFLVLSASICGYCLVDKEISDGTALFGVLLNQINAYLKVHLREI